MNLKDRLNAKADELEAKAKAETEGHERNKQMLMRELPRIYSELAMRARAMLDGVKGVKIATDQALRDIKAGDDVIGRAQLGEFEISLFGKTLAFKDDTSQYMGSHRQIEVVAKGAENPFKDGLKVLTDRTNPDVWDVWAPSINGPVPLTDELLEKALGTFFGA